MMQGSAVFYAYVDTGLSELQMFVRAKMENEDEKGERQGLSVLEQVFGVSNIKDTLSPEKLDGELKRLYGLSATLTQAKLKKLYDVERRTSSRFTIAQLERLTTMKEDKDFYMAAASTSGFGFKGDDFERAVVGKQAAYTFEWFKDIFPEYASAPPSPPEPLQRVQDGEKGQGHLEVDEPRVILTPCPRCAAKNMVHVEGQVETRRIPPCPEEAPVVGIAKTIDIDDPDCWKCKKKFFTIFKHIEGRKYAADSSVSDEFIDPQTIVEAIDVRYDYHERVWQQIVDGRIAGTIDLSGDEEGEGKNWLESGREKAEGYHLGGHSPRTLPEGCAL